MLPNWNPTSIAVATTFHSLAILSTVFRLWYRWYTARMWWEDALALVALLADIMCLVATWLEQPIPGASNPSFFTTGNWILSFAFPTVIWASRISILISMARVSHPTGALKHVAVGVGAAFGVMWIGLLGERVQVCLERACLINKSVTISQTITDCIADVLLTGLPVLFLRDVKLSRKRRLLILSTFSASMVITVVTVTQAVVLFQMVITSGTIVVGHVKYALSLIVCNLLVIVTCVYRMMNKEETGLEDSQLETSQVEFTTVDLPQTEFTQETSKGTSGSDPSAATKSSSWSFRGPGRSGITSTGTGASRVSGV